MSLRCFWIKKMLKIDVFGVKQSCTDFLATFSRQNLGKVSDMLPAIFLKK